MKNYKIYRIFILAALIFGLAACEEYEDTETVSPSAPEGCLGVYFPSTNSSTFELEPTDDKTITLSIARTDSVGTYDAPISIIVNDESIFVVPETVSFADGDAEVEFSVTFPDAAEATTYNLELQFLDEDNINPYGVGNTYVKTSITRISWETLAEPFIYIDGAISSTVFPMYVYAEKAILAESVRYRFKNVYHYATGTWTDESTYTSVADADGIYDGYPYCYPNEWDETQDYYTTIEIYDADGKSGDVYMTPAYVGFDWGDGIYSIGSIYGYLSDDLASYPYGTLADGIISFGKNSLFYDDGTGAYIAGASTYIYLSKDIYLAANLLIDDYNAVQYEEIVGEVGEFVSVAEDGSWAQTMYSAIDADAENEDSDYKNLYYLSNLYASDYGLAFYYTEATGVTIPASQPTGLEVFGSDVYVSQSEDIKSSLEVGDNGVTTYSFGLTFHFEDGTIIGNFTEVYYYAETAPAVSKESFLGNFTMSGSDVWGEDDAAMDVIITEGSGDTLLIAGITYAEEIKAVYYADSNFITIEAQELADFGAYDITFYTYDGVDYSTDNLKIGYSVTGNLVIDQSSLTSGYMLYSNAAGGFINGYNNLVFSPVVSKSATVSNRSVSTVVAKELPNNIERQDVDNNNFKIQGKMHSAKELLKEVNSIAL